MARSVQELDIELKGMRDATKERIKMYDGKIRDMDRSIESMHRSIGKLRGETGDNTVTIRALDVHVEEARDDIRRFELSLQAMEKNINDGFDTIRDSQAKWITDLSAKLWRAAGAVSVIVIGVLGLVLKG